MIQTSTLVPQNPTFQTSEILPSHESALLCEPSENAINNILNFSRNLEVRPSAIMEVIEFLKS
jgi:hypothetical protein